MKLKLGRNDLCWCKSGKKYKHCHWRRDKEDQVMPGEAIKELRRAFGKKYCLHPQANLSTCRGKIIQAHSIQRNVGLSRIERDGHVYRFFADYPKLVDSSGKLEAELIGLRKASTFTGFCAHHDDITFAPMEKEQLRPTLEQIFLLSYRSICRELFAKKSRLSLIPFYRTLDRGKDTLDQVAIQEFIDLLEAGNEAGLNDLEYHKSRYDDVLMGGDFTEVRYYVIKLENVPEIICSGTALFEIDFDGNILQNFRVLDQRLDVFSFSLLGTDDGGMIIFSWLGESEAGLKFIRSLDKLTDDEIVHAVVRFIFEFFENSYFAPDWWEGLAESEKELLEARMRASADPTIEPDRNCLKDDGLRIVTWKIRERISNLPL